MFQDFSPPSPDAGDPQRMEALRRAMANAGVSGFIVPRSDEHQGEYVPPHAERLAWLTGFTGSAGTAIVLAEKAAIFVDGRYTLQVRNQVATDLLTPINSADETPVEWLKKNLEPGSRLAYDPWLHTVNEVKKLETALASAKNELIAYDNFVDLIWQDQPDPPRAPVSHHPLRFAGKPVPEKIAIAKAALREMQADAFLLTQPDSICWMLNIRGKDVPHTPLVLAFALLHSDGKPELFIDPAKLGRELKETLSSYVTLRVESELLPRLGEINGTIALDPATTSVIFKTHSEATGNTVIEKNDPCILPKAIKNEAERNGCRQAHRRDGLAMCRFLNWLSREPIGNLTEISAAKKLEECRRMAGEDDQMPLQDISFDTISGAGANGAIVHYRVTETTNRAFSENTLYLVDSGGQYQDGTTDITRTIAIGTPDSAMKRHFTLVLKGMIAISSLRFPKGTTGAQLDAFARAALWQEGLDFDHGTGHGVGSFLSVHEGPQRISKIATIALEPGMILSNEPGYYKTNAYGIRIENLVLVREATDIEGGERPMHSFETLTFAPIDRALIAVEQLTPNELEWLNDYHRTVFEVLSPRLDETDKAWLEAATAPL